MNLRLKLFLPFVALLSVIYLASKLYILPAYESFLECEQLTNETSRLELLSAALTPDIIEKDMGHISTSMNQAINKREHWISLALFDQTGKQIYPLASAKPLETVNLTAVNHEISSGGKIHGLMTLYFDPKPGISMQVYHAKNLHYAVLAVLMLIFFTFSLFLDRLIRQPVTKLADFADDIAKGNYQTGLSISSQDEVGQLGLSLEAMRKKIYQREVAMNHYAEIQNTVRFIQSKFISDQDSSHIFLELQYRIQMLTKSDAGLIGEINHNNDQSLILKALSLEKISNIHAINQVKIQDLPDSVHTPALETLLGKVLTTGKTVVDNESGIPINQLGFPISSETTVNNFLGLPLYSGYQLIGVLGLVNKKDGFEHATFNELEVLLQTLAQLIVAIRERKALRDNENRLRLVVDSALEGIVSIDGKGSITSLNVAAERIFGYSAKQLIGRSVGLLIPPENHLNHIEAARFLLNADNTNGRKNTEIETDVLHKNGKLVPVELSFSKVIINGKVQYTGVVRDITERKQHESELNKAYAELQEAHEQLEEQNRVDPLTGLANRRYLDESLRSEWKRAQRHQDSPLTIILCDIDNFKRYNDTYGHPKGDDCLVQIAQAMAKSFTRKIDIVARYGGEEFMIVLPNTATDVAYKQADKMRKRIWNLDIEHKSSPTADRVTISVGIYTANPSRNCKLRTAIQQADEALYEAKADGRNKVLISKVLHSESVLTS